MTRIINLYGGPGAGKSTSAADLFVILKERGANVELAREYVKRWAWERRDITPYDQFYFLGKQIREETQLYGKVDILVTDKPVLMDVMYARRYSGHYVSRGVEAAVRAFYQQSAADNHEHIHVRLLRKKKYMTHGRFQSEDEAREMDREIEALLGEAPILLDMPVKHIVIEDSHQARLQLVDTLLK